MIVSLVSMMTLHGDGGILLGALPVLVRLGKDCDGHGDGTVEVHQTNNEEDPPEDDTPVLVHHDCDKSRDHCQGHEGLTDHHSCWPVSHLIKEQVWQGRIFRDIFIGDDQGHCSGHHAAQEEQEEQASLPDLIFRKNAKVVN